MIRPLLGYVGRRRSVRFWPIAAHDEGQLLTQSCPSQGSSRPEAAIDVCLLSFYVMGIHGEF